MKLLFKCTGCFSNLVYKDDIFPVGRSRCEKIQEALDKLLRLLECDAESLMFVSFILITASVARFLDLERWCRLVWRFCVQRSRWHADPGFHFQQDD
jgi:hypothetical protein